MEEKRIIRTLTGELEDKFPFFRFTDYSVMDDGSIILQNEGGKIGVRCNDGKWELIPEHDKEYPDEYIVDKAIVYTYVQFVVEIKGKKYVQKKIELKDSLSGRELLDMMQEIELYLSSNGLQKGWENIKEICEKLEGENDN